MNINWKIVISDLLFLQDTVNNKQELSWLKGQTSKLLHNQSMADKVMAKRNGFPRGNELNQCPRLKAFDLSVFRL